MAYKESTFDPNAVSKDKHDIGLFQLRDTFNKERGVVNAFDPVESTGHAIDILTKSMNRFKCTSKTLAAYRQGDRGVELNGIDSDSALYVKRIIAYSQSIRTVRLD